MEEGNRGHDMGDGYVENYYSGEKIKFLDDNMPTS